MSNNVQNQPCTEIESRLADAEARLAFQEDSLQTLSDQLAYQQQLTDQLQRSLQIIYQQLRDMRDESGTLASIQPPDETPPHY